MACWERACKLSRNDAVTAILIDEADDVFNSDLVQGTTDRTNKARINTALENTKKLTVWTTNSLRSMDAAIIRRFHFVLKVVYPPRAQMEKLAQGTLAKSLSEENISRLVNTENLPLGVLRIRGTLEEVDTTMEQYRELIDEMVDNELQNYKKMYLKERKIKHLIGIGENILYLFRYEEDGKPLSRITREQFEEFYTRLSTMNEEQMEEHFGVNREYASLLMPCAVIYKKFLEMTGAEMIWIPGVRLCDGIAAEFAADKKLIKFRHNFDNDIISTSRSMAKRYQCLSRHTETVEKYVLQVFDTMRKYHGMGQRERLLLQIAVLIHACGKFISVRNSNECAYNIIMSTEIIGISHLEREIIANVVRYNIRDFDYNMVRMETELDEVTDSFSGQNEVMLLIAKLTAMLRLANSMDRGHSAKLADCRMTVKDQNLIITTDYHGDITLESVSFEQKAAFFEEIFGIRPVLRHKKYV